MVNGLPQQHGFDNDPSRAPSYPAAASTTPTVSAASRLTDTETLNAARGGHRPFLSVAQALFLARECYGIRGLVYGDCAKAVQPRDGTARSSAISIEPVCVELPSYDDRNFRITGMQLVPEQRGRLGKELWTGPQETHQDGKRHPQHRVVHHTPSQSVILKVHNTQDDGNISQLQAMDEAMLRLQAAGVLTNTPLRPVVVSHHILAAWAVGIPGNSDCSSSSSSTDSKGIVPYRVMPVVEGGHPADTAQLFCSAYLPCTCHSPALERVERAVGAKGSISSENSPEKGGRGRVSEHAADAPISAPEEVTDYLAKGRPREGEHDVVAATETGAMVAVPVPGAGVAAGVAAEGDGQPLEAGERRRGHWHIVRCLTYVEGQMLSSVTRLTPNLLLSLGHMMGQVTCGLAGWDPLALRRCSHDWYPENGGAVLKRLVPGIQAFDWEQRALLLRVADELLTAGPRLSDPRVLPRQVCHADANDDNCVVSDDSGEVVGLIDFGDMAIMPRVCEVAITMLYALLLGLSRPMGPSARATTRHQDTSDGDGLLTRVTEDQYSAGSDGSTAAAAAEAAAAAVMMTCTDEDSDRGTVQRLLEVAGLVLCGYQRVVPLRPEELQVIPLLMRGRLAQSLALGAVSVVADPGNAAYLLATQRPGWRVIRLLVPGSVMTDEEMLRNMLAVEEGLRIGDRVY
ncbi:hypothetical protein VaNZ11_007305 [Volvox africanus]|uniref:Hydroxylysine kinase n=1 Tax=Volvox africanus TaxID=51714 RepID=A0ABQ5S2L0_9CHLO|nr:hypothetical protein VaNZ11_007305 [Volvox africanus]